MQRSPWQTALFFLAVAAVLGQIHYYLWSRLVKAPDFGPTWQRRGAVLFAFLGLLTPIGVALGRAIDRPLAKVLGVVAYTWMGLSVVLFFVTVAAEIPRVLTFLVANASRDADPGRRTFLTRAITGAIAVAAAIVSGAGMASALGTIAFARVKVPLRRLPEKLSGFRIVQLTDVHIGPTLGRAWLEGVVERVNAAEPDVVVITGDLVDGHPSELEADVAPLAGIRAKHGVFFVTGNHEYYSGVEEWMPVLERFGVKPLRNERVSVGDGEHSFDLAGVDDWSAARYGKGQGPDLARALAGRDPSRELVLLAHQPKQIHDAEKHGVGLQISGHTHGGQIFPWGYVVMLDQPFVAGLGKQGDTHIYVSRGTGFWGPPMRVAAPPEIAVLELVSA